MPASVELSVIVVFHNMRREAPRTLYSMSSHYQRGAAIREWEVIAIDHGSDDPLDEQEVRALGPRFSYLKHDANGLSPLAAINSAVGKARGRYVAIAIDGARIITPGVIDYSLRAFGAFDDPVVCTLGWHLGPELQNASIANGYSREVEDRLLESVDWRRNGYALFEISSLSDSCSEGWFGSFAESNFVSMSHGSFEQLGGFDERFMAPGGGLGNLDFLDRACAVSGSSCRPPRRGHVPPDSRRSRLERANGGAPLGLISRRVRSSARQTLLAARVAAALSWASAGRRPQVRRRRLGMTPHPRVLYVSDTPDTRSHIYRVRHQVSALKAAGVDAWWLSLDEAAARGPEGADVVIFFRQAWDERVSRLHAVCRDRGVPIGFDIDDLIFDRQVMTEENFDYLRGMDEGWRRDWLSHTVDGSRVTLTQSDFATVSTQPLAERAEALGTRSFVVPNGMDAGMISRSEEILRSPSKPSANDGRLRIGYASGTPTHQKDFAVLAGLIAALLDQLPSVMLTVVGHLDLDEFPELTGKRDRIETRPLVPHRELLNEYARLDVNLAPLECGNPFCEGKSELKYFEAALVKVPTVAAATRPYRAAITDGRNGYCARAPKNGEIALRRLSATRSFAAGWAKRLERTLSRVLDPRPGRRRRRGPFGL